MEIQVNYKDEIIPDTSEPYKAYWIENLNEVGNSFIAVDSINDIDPSAIEMIKMGLLAYCYKGSKIYIYNPNKTTILTIIGYCSVIETPKTVAGIEQALFNNKKTRDSIKQFFSDYLYAGKEIDNEFCSQLNGRHGFGIPFIISLPYFLYEEAKQLLNESKAKYKTLNSIPKSMKCQYCGHTQITNGCSEAFSECRSCGKKICI